ncbi:MAG TPA: ribosomal protein S18-alanine N-acetyltransferase [Burkholderiaceae bacterium]|nr:ribosomal protein S18-alanine N-acetyltransferase [Burkholderiaceae bacterium]
MTPALQIRLAHSADAPRIAAMSRDLIEVGLGWSWTEGRVLRSVVDPNTNVAVAYDEDELVGFGIMKYRDDEAHLHLLAVRESHRRRGVGSALMAWLERTALVAGIGVVYLEARSSNEVARAFYRALGYQEIKVVRGYYRGVESAVRLAKDLWDFKATRT